MKIVPMFRLTLFDETQERAHVEQNYKDYDV